MASQENQRWAVKFSNIPRRMKMTTFATLLQKWVFGDDLDALINCNEDFMDRTWGAGKVDATKCVTRYMVKESKDLIARAMKQKGDFTVARSVIQIVCLCSYLCFADLFFRFHF